MKRILIIDDDAELVEEMSEILRDEGHFVETAPHEAVEGFIFFKQKPYDVIVLDYKMPGLTGGDLLKKIKEKKVKSRIVLISGKPFLEKILADDGVRDAVSAIFKKPFDVETFIQEIRA
jgi:DNA-binding NtrC family response regulator